LTFNSTTLRNLLDPEQNHCGNPRRLAVVARDAFGNPATPFGGPVILALGTSPSGATLGGTTTLGASGGVADFQSLTLDQAGSGYTLTAAAAGLPTIATPAFVVSTGPVSATRSTIRAVPASIPAGGGPSTIYVTAVDVCGNLLGGAGVDVYASGSGNTFGGSFADGSGAFTATFTSTVAEPKTVSAAISAGQFSGTLTAMVTVTPGPAAQLAFAASPSTTTAGGTIGPTVQVSVQDQFGNLVPSFTGDVTVTIGNNPGGGTLSGVTTVAALSGVATFSNLSIDHAGSGYTLTATAGGLTATTSNAFDILP